MELFKLKKSSSVESGELVLMKQRVEGVEYSLVLNSENPSSEVMVSEYNDKKEKYQSHELRLVSSDDYVEDTAYGSNREDALVNLELQTRTAARKAIEEYFHTASGNINFVLRLK